MTLPWRQPRGKATVSLDDPHTNATSHLREIDLRFASGLPPGLYWIPGKTPPTVQWNRARAHQISETNAAFETPPPPRAGDVLPASAGAGDLEPAAAHGVGGGGRGRARIQPGAMARQDLAREDGAGQPPQAAHVGCHGGGTPYTPHPSPYTLHPAPYTQHPTPYAPHLTPYTLHPTPYTLQVGDPSAGLSAPAEAPAPVLRQARGRDSGELAQIKGSLLTLAKQTVCPDLQTKPSTSKPQTINYKPETMNHKG